MSDNAENCKNTFYQMLNRIRKRPEMWLGTPDIITLKTYINGYSNALLDVGVYNAKSQTALFPLDFWYMHEFAKIKTNSYESTSGWANLILEESGGDGRKAFERFYEYLDEFCSLKAVKMKKAILTEENIFANDNMLYSYKAGDLTNIPKENNSDNDEPYFRVGNYAGQKSPIYDSPQAVYIIELSGDIGFLCAVETASDIQLERYIFRKEQIFGVNKRFPSPEHVFGNLTTLTEIKCPEKPDFNKPVHW